jgi:hypothetical protein
MSTPAIRVNETYLSGILKESRRHARESVRLLAEVDKHIIGCSVSQNQNLCNEMQRLLPRELRDMVYTNLLDEDSHYDVRATRYKNNLSFDPTTPKFLKSFPHARDPTYIGSTTYTELIETWYRVTVFRLNLRSNVATLFDLKLCDLAGDLSPSQQVRNVTVTVQPRNYNAKEHYPEPEDVLMPKDFDVLAQLQGPATVTIILDLSLWIYHNTADHNVKPFFALVYEVVSPTLIVVNKQAGLISLIALIE